MRADVLVYISGPMTPRDGHTVEENVAAGLEVYLELLQLGLPAFCPQLCGAFPTAWTVVPYEEWLAYDRVMIERSTHVLMLPRWESSHGAVRERQHALEIGRPIVDSVAALQDIL